MVVYIVGKLNAFSLETSYCKALQAAGVRVRTFDIEQQQQQYIKAGPIGKLVHSFLPVDAWQYKVNRQLALDISQHKPDLILVFCTAPVLVGTLAFIRSVLAAPIWLVWPDPLLNITTHIAQSAGLYDGVATYSKATVPVFERLGFRQVAWLPLAADPILHGISTAPAAYRYDLTFVGAWRAERERAVGQIQRLFPSITIGLFGPNWHRCATRSVRALAHRQPLLGAAYAQAFNTSRITLNVIDDTCFPAANMRFFEIPIAHGLQLVSACPDFADVYRHREHVLYFDDEPTLAENIEWVMHHPKQAATLREAAYQQTREQHTYANRIAELLPIAQQAC